MIEKKMLLIKWYLSRVRLSVCSRTREDDPDLEAAAPPHPFTNRGLDLCLPADLYILAHTADLSACGLDP